MLKIILTLALVAGALFHTSYADNCDEDSVESSPIEDNSIESKNAQKCKKPNEKYVICPPKCPFGVCGIDDNLLDCAVQPQPGDPTCPEPACRCKPQFFRDDKGHCVPWEKCPTCSGKNEEYDACDAPCPARRCDFNKSIARCMSPPQVGDKECLVGCRCKDGFYKNSKKVCVPWEQCRKPTKSCPLNEYYSQCKNSPYLKKTCKDLNKKPKIDRSGPSQECEEGCVCKDGYLRAKNGTCIPNLQCDVPLPKCKSNEVLTPCGQDGCLKRYCSDLHQGPVCRDRATCTPICECKEGLLRASFDNDTCVPISECPKPPCPLNEYYSLCKNSAFSIIKDCKDINKKNVFENPEPSEACQEGCICQPGNLRAANGTCVPTLQCDAPLPKCKPNQELSPCGRDGCLKMYCSDLDLPPLCRDTFTCLPTCECVEGFLRASFDNDTCVLIEECPRSTTTEETPTTDETTTSQGSGSICDPQLQQETLSEGNTYLTGKVFYQVVKNNPGVSTFMSGFSLLPPLTQLLLYSSGETNQELKNAVNIKDQSTVRCGLPGLLDSIKGTNGTVLKLGAKTYVYAGGNLNQSFQEDSKKIFKSTPENIDFNKPQDASDTINQWVSEVTKGKITDLVNPDMFDPTTRLVLANAIYFKGIWKTQFNTNNTKPRDFHVSSDKVIQVPTMQQKGNFFYAELSDPDVQVLELKYNDGETSCVIVLPRQVDGLLSVVEKFQDPKLYKNILNSLQNVRVDVSLPRIPEITTETDLVEVLKAVGVNAIFDSSKAQLSGILHPDEPLYVSSGVQKATITIDEEGSVAAAANAAVAVALRSRPKENTFVAHHPFMFLIKRKDLILFCGTFLK